MADDRQDRTDDFGGTVRGPLRSECIGVHVECIPAGAQGGLGPEVLQGVFQPVDVSGLHAADLWSGDVLDTIRRVVASDRFRPLLGAHPLIAQWLVDYPRSCVLVETRLRGRIRAGWNSLPEGGDPLNRRL